MMQYMINPQAYATALGSHSSPTERQKNIAALYPVGSPQYNAAMQSGLTKDFYIAPTSLSEGGSLYAPGATTPFAIANKGGLTTDPRTNAVTVQPGYIQSSGEIAQNQAFNTGVGQARTTKDTKIDPDTGNTIGTTAADVMGLPAQGSGANNQQRSAPAITQINPVMTAIETGNNDLSAIKPSACSTPAPSTSPGLSAFPVLKFPLYIFSATPVTCK
jgi:hypothetical protein